MANGLDFGSSRGEDRVGVGVQRCDRRAVRLHAFSSEPKEAIPVYMQSEVSAGLFVSSHDDDEAAALAAARGARRYGQAPQA